MGIAGLEVRLDGTLLERVQWSQPVPVDPGDHVLTAVLPGKKPWQDKVTVVAGGALVGTTVPVLDSNEAPPPTAVVAKDSARPIGAMQSKISVTTPRAAQTEQANGSSARFNRRVAAVFIGAMGAAGVIVGSALAVKASSLWGEADNTVCHGQEQCVSTTSLQDNAARVTVGSVVNFIGSAATFYAAGYLWVTAPSAQKRSTSARWSITPYATPDGAGSLVRGTF